MRISKSWEGFESILLLSNGHGGQRRMVRAHLPVFKCPVVLFSLSLGWPCVAKECSWSAATWLPRVHHKKPCSYCFGLLEGSLLECSLQIQLPCCKKPKPHGKATYKHSGRKPQLNSQLTARINCQPCEHTVFYVRLSQVFWKIQHLTTIWEWLNMVNR